jgi:hypothetical protein
MSDVTAQLLEIRKKALSQNKVETAPDPVEVQPEIPKSTEEPSKPVAQEVTKDQPKKEEKKEEVEQTEPETSMSWDADETEVTTKVESPKFDLSKLGSALELGEIKDESEFVAKVSEMKTKLKSLEEAPLSGLDDEAKEVIKVMKSGGNWKEYLSNQIVDYTKVDPAQLFEDTFFDNAMKNPKYYTDGKFDEEKVKEALSTFSEPQKEDRGMQIAESLNSIQKQRKQQELRMAEEKLANAEKALGKASKSLQELLPVENYGIKFEPKHSSEIYKGIANSDLTRKYLGVNYETLVAQGANMNDIVATIAARHYLEKMIKFKAQNSKVEAKKEILEKTQNAQIKNTGSVVQPEDQEKKILTPAEKIAKHLSANKKGL